MENTPALSNIERQRLLIQLLVHRQRLSIPEICSEFSISEATARRDLETLAAQGLLQRVHGGAIVIRRARPEQPVLVRSQEQAEQKQRIGRAAAALITEGETIFLGSGTTVLEVARSLVEHTALTVITNSLPIINLLAGQPTITVVALGGMLRHSELSFIGHITAQALAEVRADKIIIGIRGLSIENGLTNEYLPETLTDRAVLRTGKEVIIVADSTKCGCTSAAFVAPITSIHRLVTDNEVDLAFTQNLEALGIQVTIA